MKKVLTKIKNMPKKIVASFAVVATALGIAGYSIVNAGVAPVHHKSVTTNNDGTYKISLDITGDADITSTTASANVLLVYDTSGSMLGHFVDNTGSYAHTGSYVNTGWRQLYKRPYPTLGSDRDLRGKACGELYCQGNSSHYHPWACSY